MSQPTPSTKDKAVGRAPRLPARVDTPDVISTDADGHETTTFVLKRACNGCRQLLGDLDGRDLDGRGELTDVRDECPACRPLVALESEGCKTWHVTARSIAAVDNEVDRYGIYAKGYWQEVDGKLAVVGLRVGSDEKRVVAYFGDWLIWHPDGRWAVHKGPQADAVPALTTVPTGPRQETRP